MARRRLPPRTYHAAIGLLQRLIATVQVDTRIDMAEKETIESHCGALTALLARVNARKASEPNQTSE